MPAERRGDMRRRSGEILIGLGTVLLLLALSLALYNHRTACQAGCASQEVLRRLKEETAEQGPEEEKILQNCPPEDGIMPEKTADGYEYIGILEIPRFGLELPVMSTWSYEGLRISPGRYSGSVWTKDLVICAHNYERHFGNLKNLENGDKVIFTDVLDNRFEYEVVRVETLEPHAVDALASCIWDMTLFTCTAGGASRVTVRCMLTEESDFGRFSWQEETGTASARRAG